MLEICFAVWSIDMIWPNKIVVTISLSKLSRWAKFVARKCLVLRNGKFLSIIFVNILSLNYKFRFDKFYWNFIATGTYSSSFTPMKSFIYSLNFQFTWEVCKDFEMSTFCFARQFFAATNFEWLSNCCLCRPCRCQLQIGAVSDWLRYFS